MPAVAAPGTLAVAALAATLAVAGCGGGDDEGTTLRFVLRPQGQE
jgi:hypothetical protein